MTIDIKTDKSIPPGYTYKRCDTYTADELIAACSAGGNRGLTRCGRKNPYAEEYVRQNPKQQYTVDDKMAIWEMATRAADLRIAFGGTGRKNA